MGILHFSRGYVSFLVILELTHVFYKKNVIKKTCSFNLHLSLCTLGKSFFKFLVHSDFISTIWIPLEEIASLLLTNMYRLVWYSFDVQTKSMALLLEYNKPTHKIINHYLINFLPTSLDSWHPLAP